MEGTPHELGNHRILGAWNYEQPLVEPQPSQT